MKFEMKKPCADCPFRSDGKGIGLEPGRIREIVRALTLEDKTFACHKTVDYEGESSTSTQQHCAGAMIFLEKNDRPNQMMRIAERIGRYDRTGLDMTFPVFATQTEMLDGQPEYMEKKRSAQTRKQRPRWGQERKKS